jgi:hypothetical protein
MTPIEAMARAFWEKDGLKINDQIENWRDIEPNMRAALLALADVELPKGVSQAGGFAMDGLDEKAELAFRAMLRSIAQGDA